MAPIKTYAVGVMFALIMCFVAVQYYNGTFARDFVEETINNRQGIIRDYCADLHLNNSEFKSWFRRIAPEMESLTAKQKNANAFLEGHIWNFKSNTFLRIPQLCAYFSYLKNNQDRIKTICEIGFNGGHSTLMYSSILKGNVSIVSFDLCTSRNCEIGRTEILKRFPKLKLEIVKGNSTIQVPEYSRRRPDHKCDFMSIDGGHFGTVPYNDIINMQLLASDNHIVVIDDVDPTSEQEYLRTVGRAWELAIRKGIVMQTGSCSFCYTDHRGEHTCKFCFGKYAQNR